MCCCVTGFSTNKKAKADIVMSASEHKTRLSDMAQEEILYRINSGELTPGTRLPSEPELARQMGISRGILREALNSLEAKGYITRIPRGGSHITQREESEMSESFSRALISADLSELLSLREAIELYCFRLAAEQYNEEELDKLEKLLDRTDITPEQIDRAFHYSITRMSGNNLFQQLIALYFDRAQQMRLPAVTKKRLSAAEAEHRRILEALRNQDMRGGQASLRKHFRNIRKRCFIL